MHAAVVELDALANSIRARTENDHPVARRRADLARIFVRAVVIRRRRLELRGARVDGLERRDDARRATKRRDVLSGACAQVSDLRIGEPPLFVTPPLTGAELLQHDAGTQFALALDDLAQLLDEPAVDAGAMNDVLDRRAAPEQFVQREQPLRCRDDRTVPEPLEVDVHELRVASEREPGATLFEGANGLLERFGEVSTNGHHLAYRLHSRAEFGRRARQLLEGPARDLRDHVVDHRLKTGRGHFGDVVSNFVERVADGQSSGDLRDREAGGLGGQRA